MGANRLDAGRFRLVSEDLLAELRARCEDPPAAVPTPFPSWNRVCRGDGGGQGIGRGWFVVLSGPTGAGKTLVALNVVAEALQRGLVVLFFSLEMDWRQLLVRLRAIVAEEDVMHLEPGTSYCGATASLADRKILHGLPGELVLNTEPIWKLADIRETIARWQENYEVGLVVVDYAQLVAPGGSDRALYEAISETSSQLRYAAQQYDVATLVLSQLNRQTTADRTAPPTVDGLFGSSRLGFDADQVLILDHTRRKRRESERLESTFLRIAKNRHGPQGEIPVVFEKRSLTWREMQPHEEDELWPGGAR